MKKIPAIKSVMTAFPYWIDVDDNVDSAIKMMSDHDISHLPVKEKGKIIAVVALHDIKKMDAAIVNFDPTTVLVKDICVLDPYMVELDEPLDNVLVHMANFHIGSVLVLKNHRLAGVFTMHDACRCFAESLRYQFRVESGDDIA